MKVLSRILMFAAGIAVAALPAARAADDNPPAPAPTPAPAAPANDQPAARPERRGRMDPAQMLEQLKTTLDLTDDQMAKVKELFKAQAEKRQAIMADDSLSREDRWAKGRDLMSPPTTRSARCSRPTSSRNSMRCRARVGECAVRVLPAGRRRPRTMPRPRRRTMPRLLLLQAAPPETGRFAGERNPRPLITRRGALRPAAV